MIALLVLCVIVSTIDVLQYNSYESLQFDDYDTYYCLTKLRGVIQKIRVKFWTIWLIASFSSHVNLTFNLHDSILSFPTQIMLLLIWFVNILFSYKYDFLCISSSVIKLTKVHQQMFWCTRKQLVEKSESFSTSKSKAGVSNMRPARYVCAARYIIKITQIIAETTVFCSIKALIASYLGPRRHFSS